ncbi:MAG: alpha/beta fold hydrolase [Actinophytocola sp.]|uniref:alpha/beta fold hydrolase n=1 Tax=Actinophytocola sp. TaxID=1872138 RepID=UPI001325D21E|nr:alpha/beta hydrolase [Actinophytocola sp.]MPZ83576.1 alpha/beta fold hydrolase [Actinophytocola sp.]
MSLTTVKRTIRGRVLRPIVARVFPGAVGTDTSQPLPVSVPGSGATVVVTDLGEGPAILLVHPGSTTAAAWAGCAAALSDRFRVLSHDRPTYRRVPALRGAAAMDAEVDEVLAIADVAMEPVLLVGHSSGGVVALESALAAPERFSGLVLYEPPVAVDAPLGGDALRRARSALDAGAPGRAMAIFVRDISGGSPLLARLFSRRWAAAQLADAEAIESLGVGLDRYAGLDLPTLLIGGERSPAHLRARLDALAAVLPRVDRTVILPGQGHLATLRAPHLVTAAIASFADRVA